MALAKDDRRYLTLAISISLPAVGVMYIGFYNDSLEGYVEAVTTGLLLAGTLLTVINISKVKSPSLKWTTGLFATGFGLQFGYAVALLIGPSLENPFPSIGVDNTAMGLSLASYVFWIAAILLDRGSPRRPMNTDSITVLGAYAVAGAAVIWRGGRYWLDYASDGGYDGVTAGLWLGYVVFPVVAVGFVAFYLLNGGWGRGRETGYNWRYFIVPIALVALADGLSVGYPAWAGGTVPALADWAVYIAACSFIVAGGLILRLSDKWPSVEPQA